MKRIHIIIVLTLFVSISYANVSSLSEKQANSLRIMCYNVHNCKGMDGQFDYERIAGVMNRVQADVIAVQELDSVTKRNKGIYALQKLAEKTRMYYTYGSSIDFQGGKYGIGILSKEKPLGSKKYPLPGREEKRMLLVVEFKDYVVCCTHFSLTAEDQLTSVPILIKATKGYDKPVFLAGDMNSVYDSDTQVALKKKFTPLNNYKNNTIPVVKPNRCIDFIYKRNSEKYCISVLRREVLSEEQVASDHLPLFVDVCFKTADSK